MALRRSARHAPPPDLTGQVIVVTGANSGIGKETSLALAGMGATVAMAARNPESGRAAADQVRVRSGGGDVHDLRLDLADLGSVDRFADEVLERFDRLDVLVNNAGLVVGRFQRTADGFEETVGVNHLGHFHLTNRLLDRLQASAPARVVVVASIAHRGATNGMILADLQSELSYEQMEAYSKSKLANVLFARELAHRLEGTGVTANSLHPGVIRSGFARNGDASGWLKVLAPLGAPFMISPRRGARTTVYLASSPDVAEVSGRYFIRRKPRATSPPGRDDLAASWLWEESERLLATVGR